MIEIRGIRIDKTARRVWVNGEEKQFTTKEFDLLTFLAEHPNHVFTKEELFREIWDMESIGDIATVTVHIKKIREKIEMNTNKPQYIETIWGVDVYKRQVTESIFENRFKYVGELARMGANFKVESNIAIIGGIENYTGARVNAPDLRAGAALVIAGLAAEGITVVDDIYYIERGYEEFEKKLASLGAVIEKVSTEKEIQKFTLKVS